MSLHGSWSLAPSLTPAGRRQPSQAWGTGPVALGVDVSAESGPATRGSGFNYQLLRVLAREGRRRVVGHSGQRVVAVGLGGAPSS